MIQLSWIFILTLYINGIKVIWTSIVIESNVSGIKEIKLNYSMIWHEVIPFLDIWLHIINGIEALHL
jgi:hypothetical protein